MTIRYRKSIGKIESWIDEFTGSTHHDVRIAKVTARILKEHVASLSETGLIPGEAAKQIIELLEKISDNPSELLELMESGNFEDIHEALEALLYSRLGPLAGYAPLGRSRNDHVSAALRLKVAEEALEILSLLIFLREKLLEKAGENTKTVFPTHTHFQPAQASTFAHYILSFEEELADLTDIMLVELENIVLKSPLGSAAGAGTCVPLDREKLSSKLGFTDVIHSPLYGTGSRVFLQRFVSSLLQLATVIQRFLNDLFLFSNPRLGLLRIPEHHLQTSSLMPHKRNPATVEVARARLSELSGVLATLYTIESRLPSGYSLDLQEMTPHAWRASDTMKSVLRILSDLIEGLSVNIMKVEEYLQSYVNGVTELVELISLSKNEPFRKVHLEMAKTLSENNWNVSLAVRVMSTKYGVGKDVFDKIESPEKQVECKTTSGSFEHAEKILKLEQERLMNHTRKMRLLKQRIGENESA